MKKPVVDAYKNEIEQLKKALEEKDKMLKIRDQELSSLKEQLVALKRRLFGPKSERTKTLLNDDVQMSLFNEAELEGQPTPEPEVTESKVKSHIRHKHSAKKLDLSGMESTTVTHDIPEEERKCKECGSNNLVLIGHELIGYKLHIKPATYTVEKHVRAVYKCADCSTDERTVITKADAPKPLVPHSPVTASSATMTLLNKFQFALPFSRQEKLWSMMGIHISKATLANWSLYVYRDWLAPLINLMHKQLLREDVIHADETRVQVMKEKGRDNKAKSFMWLYSSGQFSSRQIRIFQYQPSRSGICAEAFLEGFSGYLHTDAFPGYNRLSGVTHCFCYAHARRKFVDALPQGVEKPDDTIPGQAIKKINELFRLEEEFASLSPEERQLQRDKQARPKILALFEYLESKLSMVTQSSNLAKAINYMVGNKSMFMNYLLDGRCSISNNIAERSIRPFTIGRKNWVLSGSPRGAEASAGIYSMVETCIANKVDTRDYFMYIFEHMPLEEDITNEQILEKYLPWNVPLAHTDDE